MYHGCDGAARASDFEDGLAVDSLDGKSSCIRCCTFDPALGYPSSRWRPDPFLSFKLFRDTLQLIAQVLIIQKLLMQLAFLVKRW